MVASRWLFALVCIVALGSATVIPALGAGSARAAHGGVLII